MGSVLAVVASDERSLVRALAHRLHPAAARVPGVSGRLRRRTCLQVAAIAPQLPGDRLSLLLRHALWSFWLDNRLDEAGMDVAEATRVRDGVAAVVAGQEACLTDPLLAELAHIVCELSRYDQTGDLMEWYGGALCETMVAEVELLRLRHGRAGSRPVPTAEQYLALAGESVNYRSFTYALLATGDDPLTSAQLRCIDAALRRGSLAVRLANDGQSLARDDSSGALNVLRLRTASHEAVTDSYVWDEVTRHVWSHDATLRALSSLGAVPAGPAHALTRCLAQVVGLYRTSDLR